MEGSCNGGDREAILERTLLTDPRHITVRIRYAEIGNGGNSHLYGLIAFPV